MKTTTELGQLEQLTYDQKKLEADLVLFSESEYETVKGAVASSVLAPKEILNKLAEDESFLVRSFVASNPMTGEATLLKLAEDDSYVVRRSLLFNPHTSKKVLECLAEDMDKVDDRVNQKRLDFYNRNAKAIEKVDMDTLREIETDNARMISMLVKTFAEEKGISLS